MGVMPDLDRGAFPFGIGAALAAALLLFCLPAAASEEDSSSAVSAPVVTDGECEDRWTESEADDSCKNESVTADGGLCRVEADCVAFLTSISSDDSSSSDVTYYHTEIQATPDEVARLYNCGGVLTIGSC